MTFRTPFESRLCSVAEEARAAHDWSTVELLADLVAHVQAGRYREMSDQFRLLRPLYRTRLGAPPGDRTADLAPDDGRGGRPPA